jgi:serine/threonine-protein kinase
MMTGAPRESAATQVITQPKSNETTAIIELPPGQVQVQRQPVVWPWFALIGLLALTAISVVVAIIVTSIQPPVPTPSPVPSQSFSNNPSPSASASSSTPGTVVVLLSDLQGKNVAEVSNILTGMGLNVTAEPGTVLTADDPAVMTVYDVSPAGTVAVGSRVTVTYYVGGAVAPTPSASDTPAAQ